MLRYLINIVGSIALVLFWCCEQLLNICKKNPIISFFFAIIIFIWQLPDPTQYSSQPIAYTTQPEVNLQYKPRFSEDEKKYFLERANYAITNIADFHGEFDDIWSDQSLDEAKELGLSEDEDIDVFDSIKEKDIPVGFDKESENNFIQQLKNLNIRSGFLPSLRINPTERSLPGLQYAPGLASDSNRDSKIFQDRKLSVKTEERFNKRRKSDDYIGIAIKDGQPFYHAFGQLRDKYYHSWIFPNSLSPDMSKTKLKKIQNISRNDDKKSYKRRLTKLRDKNLISDQNIATLNGYLREHVIDPDTYVIRGTLGAKREQRNPFVKKCEGYHLYNDKTRVVAFYDLNDRNLRTFMAVKQSDRTDLLLNGNLN